MRENKGNMTRIYVLLVWHTSWNMDEILYIYDDILFVRTSDHVYLVYFVPFIDYYSLRVARKRSLLTFVPNKLLMSWDELFLTFSNETDRAYWTAWRSTWDGRWQTQRESDPYRVCGASSILQAPCGRGFVSTSSPNKVICSSTAALVTRENISRRANNLATSKVSDWDCDWSPEKVGNRDYERARGLVLHRRHVIGFHI